MISKYFRPKKFYKLIRIGPRNIGGFVLEEVGFNKSNCLMSLGISTNIEFELDYFKKKNCKIHMYDHTSGPNFWRNMYYLNMLLFFKSLITLNLKKFDFSLKQFNSIKKYKNFLLLKKVKFFEEGVGFGRYGADIKKIIGRAKSKNIMFKINIEHSEYRILDELIKYKSLIDGIVVEFHDADIHKRLIEKFLKKLCFNVIHVCVSGRDYSGKKIPSSITLTLSKYGKIISQKPNYPNKFDVYLNKTNSHKYLIDLAKNI